MRFSVVMFHATGTVQWPNCWSVNKVDIWGRVRKQRQTAGVTVGSSQKLSKKTSKGWLVLAYSCCQTFASFWSHYKLLQHPLLLVLLEPNGLNGNTGQHWGQKSRRHMFKIIDWTNGWLEKLGWTSIFDNLGVEPIKDLVSWLQSIRLLLFLLSNIFACSQQLSHKPFFHSFLCQISNFAFLHIHLLLVSLPCLKLRIQRHPTTQNGAAEVLHHPHGAAVLRSFMVEEKANPQCPNKTIQRYQKWLETRNPKQKFYWFYWNEQDPKQKFLETKKMPTEMTHKTWVFPKIGVFPPKSSILIGFPLYSPSIFGYPYFWKHPHLENLGLELQGSGGRDDSGGGVNVVYVTKIIYLYIYIYIL